MDLIKRNYGWVLVAIFALLPLLPISGLIITAITEGVFTNNMGPGGKETLGMLYHISGEFAIRWMTAVLTLTPFFILFGVTNLFVRQAMGISTAFWSFLHFIIFIWAEGLVETFTQVNYVAGFIATLILIPLFFTSNRKSMKRLKTNWKKLQRFAYLAAVLGLLHVIILEKTWTIYAIILIIGFMIRIPIIKERIIKKRIGLKNK